MFSTTQAPQTMCSAHALFVVAVFMLKAPPP